MSNYVKFAAEAGDQYLAALAEQQETFLKSVAAYSDVVSKASASTPDFFSSIPTPKEVTEANFAFATKLLKQQKDFADKLLNTSTVPAPQSTPAS